MRCILFVFLVFMTLAFIAGAPKKQACSPCDFRYEPICASPKSGKGPDLSFGSTCVMETYNCEHNDNQYELKGTGECPGAGGIRLS